MSIIERHFIDVLSDDARWYVKRMADSELVVYVWIFLCDIGNDDGGGPNLLPNVMNYWPRAIYLISLLNLQASRLGCWPNNLIVVTDEGKIGRASCRERV